MRRHIESRRTGWGQWCARWRQWCVSGPSVLRRVAGFPDYPAYLEHCRRAGHAPRLSERQFLDAYFTARARPTRCC